MAHILKQLKISLMVLIIFTILTGIIYPAGVTLIAQIIFPWQANGSLLKKNGKIIGSSLLGQEIYAPQYFFGRPSFGPNLGPSNPALLAIIKTRINQNRFYMTDNKNLIPIDLITTSGSTLDPEISALSAFYQIPRIANLNKIPEIELENLIKKLIKNSKINVLELNLALDELRSKHG